MKYDLSKHSLIEDNGEHIATFNLCVPAGRAFQILDNLNDWKCIPDLESNIDVLDHEKRMLEEDLDQLNDKVTDLKTKISFQKNQLDEIYDVVDRDFEEYSKEEMVEIIKAICLRK